MSTYGSVCWSRTSSSDLPYLQNCSHIVINKNHSLARHNLIETNLSVLTEKLLTQCYKQQSIARSLNKMGTDPLIHSLRYHFHLVRTRETIKHYTQTHIKVKKQRVYCCSAIHSHCRIFNNEHNYYPEMSVKWPVACMNLHRIAKYFNRGYTYQYTCIIH